MFGGKLADGIGFTVVDVFVEDPGDFETSCSQIDLAFFIHRMKCLILVLLT